MGKIDRLGWAAGARIQSYGVSAGVRVQDPAVLPALLQRLPPGARHQPAGPVDRLFSLVAGGAGRAGTRRFHLLYADHALVGRSREAEEVLDAFESELRLFVAERAPGHVFVHAGVVGWRGRAIVIPGSSFSGKSRLVAALVRAGATYYSDEYAVLDGRGRVHPFPAPLSLRRPVGPPLRTPVRELGAAVGERPLPLGLVAVGVYRPGARWRPRRLSAGEAVLALLEHTVPARHKPAQALDALRQAVAGCTAWKGARGEAEDVTPSLLEKMA